MDIEKLIERLNGYFDGKPLPRGVALDTATTLSTLQAENEKLRDDVVRFNDMLASYQNVLVPELRAELEQVKREMDAAVKVIERVRSCKDCGHYTGEWTPPCKECQDSEEHHPCFKWRGQKEE